MEEPSYDDLFEDYQDVGEEFDLVHDDLEEQYLQEEMHHASETTTKTSTEGLSAEDNAADNNDERTDHPSEPAAEASAVRAAFEHRPRDVDFADEDDAFAFERYTSVLLWRDEGRNPDDDENTSRAVSFRDKLLTQASLNKNSTRKAGSGASSWQLTDFLEQRKGRDLVAPLRHMSQRPIPGKTCITMTLGDEKRVYFSRNQELTRNIVSARNINKPGESLLGEPMSSLMARVDRIRRMNELQNQRNHAAASSTNDKSGDEDTHDERKDNNDTKAEQEEAATIPSYSTPDNSDSRLWVDKHAPHHFWDLLSEERTNREVLRSLREWDPYVFQKEPPPRPAFQRGDKDAHANNYYGKNRTNTQQQSLRNPKDKRPEENSRVILLSGPPGVGKTTLAHIVARHAGYRPMEINGSDDRSASVLTDHVVRAMESSKLSYSKESSKPNCIIIDEVDGADAKGAVQALVDIIRAELPSAGSRKGSNKQQYLRRPIIFICNNKYAPALRPLLPFAKHFHVNPPQTSRLVGRLRAVLSYEHIALNGGNSLLNQLVTATCGDIRSCLYTLQFASAKARNMSTDEDAGASLEISKALTDALTGDGMKDESSDVTTALSSVFRRQKDQKFGSFKVAVAGGASAVTRVLGTIERFGDNSRVLDSLFLNVPRVAYIDPTFDRCAAACEWLSSSDLYRAHSGTATMRNAGDMFAMEALHVPTAAGAIHLLCCVEQRPHLIYTTRELMDNRYSKESNMALLQKFIDGFPVDTASSRCLSMACIELIPFLLWILSAGEGSSSLQRAITSVDLLNKGEREAFDCHVSTLQNVGLTYVVAIDENTRTESRSGSLPMILEPPIHKLSSFEALVPTRQDLSLAMKDLIRRTIIQNRLSGRRKNEIVQENAAFSGALNEPRGERKRESPVKLTNSVSKKTKTSLYATNFLKLGARKAREAKFARNAARVGIVPSNKNRCSHTGSGMPLSGVVRLKHVKGFTQAVRTPCKIDDLL